MRAIVAVIAIVPIVWAVGRDIYRAGAAIHRWSDADQLDYVFLPLLSCLLPYAITVTVVLIAVGNGWLRHDEPK